MARRLRQVVDLYQVGEVRVLKDGLPVWVQPLNPFESDTARNEAQIAKTRLSMAIREFGSEEQERVRTYFLSDGLEGARERLVEAKTTERTPKVFDAVRNDPEWTERLTILDRGDTDTAPLESEEGQLLTKIAHEYAMELNDRIEKEREYQVQAYANASEDKLWEDYLQWFIDRRANEKMMTEFRLHQIYFGVRDCAAEQVDDEWDHSRCNGHTERLFADKDEIRNAPESLLDVLYEACDEIDMTAREAKNSDRQGSSSDSSPLPSEAEESTPSTQEETRAEPPGTSSSQSDTHSPSLAGVS